MSIGGPRFLPYSTVSGTAPDTDQIVPCQGCKSLTLQVSNQGIQITFGRGPAGAIVWDLVPEPYLPVTGSISPSGGFDAFKWRALTPLAQLPPGATQAFAILSPRQ